jgi:hypothetical protein
LGENRQSFTPTGLAQAVPTDSAVSLLETHPKEILQKEKAICRNTIIVALFKIAQTANHPVTQYF